MDGASPVKTCLVVDDSRVVRLVARKILEGFDFRVAEAADGREALDYCRTQFPDAVLLDWNMPVMDGLAFLRALRALPGGAAPRVVFCTTETDLAQMAQSIEAGADEYIMKPFDADIVEAKFAQVGLL